MRVKLYPDDYVGPKAGESTDEEWLAVRPIQAMRWIVDGTWTYSDFDCWLSSRDAWHYSRGRDDAIAALKEFHNITKK